MISFVAAFRKRSMAEIGLALEAWVALILAAFAVRFLRWTTIRRLASREIAEGRRRTDGDLRLPTMVRFAIGAASRRSPFRSMCFEQGLAAQWMLRRRNVDSRLHYGIVGSATRPLEAHVWVMVGEFPICGERGAKDFTSVVTMPAA